MLRAAVTIAVLAGCGTTRSPGDVSYSQGRHAEAAELYDGELRDNPNDGELLEKRERARNATLRTQLSRAVTAQTAGRLEEAAHLLDDVLGRRGTWMLSMEMSTAQALASATAALGAAIERDIARATDGAGPLTGAARIDTFAPFLAHTEFADTHRKIGQRVARAGDAVCARLAPTATTPYWTLIVSRYCRTIAGHEIPLLQLPHAIAGLDLTLELRDLSPDNNLALRNALAAAFTRSVWFGRGGLLIRAKITGSMATTFVATPVTLLAHYTEQVAYTAYETKTETEQVPHQELETYYEQVPRTEYETVYESCGTSTCPRTRSHTVYRSEMRTRTVTKYTSQTKSTTVPVTKYRTESRSHSYAAVERTGAYASDLRMTLSAPLAGLTAWAKNELAQAGIDHDETFSPANLVPRRANLMPRDVFVAQESERLGDSLRTILDERYQKDFCSASLFTLEEAARCAYLDPTTVPTSAHAMLRAKLGGDEAHLARLGLRPTE